jgi:hypothetical protein
MWVGGLACGSTPSSEESSGIVTGFPLDTGEDDSGADSDGYPMCLEPGWFCGEYGICRCTGDTLDCGCESVECTTHEQCGEDRTCAWIGTQKQPDRVCVPSDCDQLSGLILIGDADPSGFEDMLCAEFVSFQETPWAAITGLDSLLYVHFHLLVASNPALLDLDGLTTLERVGQLQIQGNPSLVSVAGLAGLQEIVDGGAFTDNPMLPTADVEALLAQIPGGDTVLVCGNLDGDPC